MGSDALEALDEMTAEELRALVRALAPSLHAEQRALLQERLAARDREPDEAAVAPADLAATARRTRSFRDLRAWCRALEEAGDWRGARAAAEEAAQLIAPHPIGPATFLDDAALAAQQLDADDLDALLERAWRAGPTLVRLRRWLGAAADRDELRDRARAALPAVPADETPQRALLHLVLGQHPPAAALLAAVDPGTWGEPHHPGDLLFGAFAHLLGAGPLRLPGTVEKIPPSLRGGPALRTPRVAALLRRTALEPPQPADRASISAAMRAAAEQRLDAVTGYRLRGRYRHAAHLATTYARVDPDDGAAWLSDLAARYRRFAALRRELESSGS